MGFESGESTGSGAGVRPISRDRIETYLKENEYHYFIDSDGDLGGQWVGGIIYFTLAGDQDEILYVQSLWARQLPLTMWIPALEACNEIHEKKYWPKLIASAGEEYVSIKAEYVVDLETGVTDAQLDAHLTCAIGTINRAFKDLAQRFP